MGRIESVWIGKDAPLLDIMFDFYKPHAKRVVDVCCNERRMWKGSRWSKMVAYYDKDPAVNPDVVSNWDCLPDTKQTVDVLVYDPPHLPIAAASPKSMQQMASDYGLVGIKGDNIAAIHAPFLREAKRALKADGLIFSKIKDYIHNHRYQWNLQYFNSEVLRCGLTPCDLIIKRDPCGGNLKSGRWEKAHHAKNVHCYWVVVRNGSCEPKSSPWHVTDNVNNLLT